MPLSLLLPEQPECLPHAGLTWTCSRSLQIIGTCHEPSNLLQLWVRIGHERTRGGITRVAEWVHKTHGEYLTTKHSRQSPKATATTHEISALRFSKIVLEKPFPLAHSLDDFRYRRRSIHSPLCQHRVRQRGVQRQIRARSHQLLVLVDP